MGAEFIGYWKFIGYRKSTPPSTVRPAMTTPEPKPAEVPADALIAGLDVIRAGTYRGQDRERLATVTVDGNGLVVRVVFAGSVGGRDRQDVEKAVQAAMRAAQQRLIKAY